MNYGKRKLFFLFSRFSYTKCNLSSLGLLSVTGYPQLRLARFVKLPKVYSISIRTSLAIVLHIPEAREDKVPLV